MYFYTKKILFHFFKKQAYCNQNIFVLFICFECMQTYIFCFIVVAVAVSINTIYYFTLVYSKLTCTSIFTGRMGSQFCTFFLSTCYTDISIYKRVEFSVYCIILIFHVCNLSNSIKTLWLTIKLMVPCLHSVMVWHWECLISENSSVDQGLLYWVFFWGSWNKQIFNSDSWNYFCNTFLT